MGKELRTGTLLVHRVGNMFYDREFADVSLKSVAVRMQIHVISEPFPARCSAS